MSVHIHVIKDFNHLTQANLVNLRTGVVVGHHLLQAWVLLAYFFKCMVNDLSDFWVMRHACDTLPTSILWNPEHMFCRIFVTVFFETFTFSNKLIVPFLETIADIFQEHKTKNHILIFGCSQIAAKFIGTVPDTIFNRLLLDNLCFLCHSIEFFIFRYC